MQFLTKYLRPLSLSLISCLLLIPLGGAAQSQRVPDIVGVWAVTNVWGISDDTSYLSFDASGTGNFSYYNPSKQFLWYLTENQLSLSFEPDVVFTYDLIAITENHAILRNLDYGKYFDYLVLTRFSASISNTSAVTIDENQVLGRWEFKGYYDHDYRDLIFENGTMSQTGFIAGRDQVITDPYVIEDGKILVQPEASNEYSLQILYFDPTMMVLGGADWNLLVVRSEAQDPTETVTVDIIGVWQLFGSAEQVPFAEFRDDGNGIFFADGVHVEIKYHLEGSQLTISDSMGHIADGKIEFISPDTFTLELDRNQLMRFASPESEPISEPQIRSYMLTRDLRTIQPQTLANTEWQNPYVRFSFAETSFVMENFQKFPGTYQLIGDTLVLSYQSGNNNTRPYLVQRIDSTFLILVNPDETPLPIILFKVLPLKPPTIWELEETISRCSLYNVNC